MAKKNPITMKLNPEFRTSLKSLSAELERDMIEVSKELANLLKEDDIRKRLRRK